MDIIGRARTDLLMHLYRVLLYTILVGVAPDENGRVGSMSVIHL